MNGKNLLSYWLKDNFSTYHHSMSSKNIATWIDTIWKSFWRNKIMIGIVMPICFSNLLYLKLLKYESWNIIWM